MRCNALRRAASSGPGAAGLGTREANLQSTAFETSFGRRDVAPASVGVGKIDANQEGPELHLLRSRLMTPTRYRLDEGFEYGHARTMPP